MLLKRYDEGKKDTTETGNQSGMEKKASDTMRGLFSYSDSSHELNTTRDRVAGRFQYRRATLEATRA